jgi:hypothetical protein
MYNDYNFTFAGGQENFKVKFYSGIRDWSGKFDFDYYSKFNHNLNLVVNIHIIHLPQAP